MCRHAISSGILERAGWIHPHGTIYRHRGRCSETAEAGHQEQVNEVLRQNSSTDMFIFDIPHVIAELSAGMTLKPGTIIAMGTPAGVGMGMDSPKIPESRGCCGVRN